MARTTATLVFTLCIACGVVFAGQGRMVFLTVVQKPHSIRVIEARIVDGAPRGRSSGRSASALYEQRTAAGQVIQSGSVPKPPPRTFDIPDSLGRLSGGVVPQDSVVFSFRVPYKDSAATIHFFSVDNAGRPDGAQKTSAKAAEIGSFDMRKAVR